MNDAVVNFKTSKVLKNQAMAVAEDLGFSLSSLLNAYLKNLVKKKAVNYSLTKTDDFIDGIKRRKI